MNWPTKQVSQLCLLAVDCVNKTAPRVEYETPYKMIRTTNVKGGFIYLDDVGYVTEDVFEKWTRRSKPKFGDVILTREAPVGEVGRFTSTDESIFLGQRLFHYRPNPDLLDWNFLAYALQSHEVQGRLRAMGFGATVEHIKVGDAENLLIPCPPVDIQRKIGEILANYDDLIENNRRRMTLLEQSARLLYEEWFVRLRFPGHEHTRIVDGVPEGWERKKLGQCITLKYGKALKAEDRVAGDYPVYGSSGIVGSHDKPLVKGPAIILGRKGNVGSVYWSSKSFYPIDTVYFVEAESSSIYLYYALKNMHFISTDVAVPGLNRDFAYSRMLLQPTTAIHRAFLEAVAPVHAQLETLDELNQKLRATRDLLLPRLMSGELVA
ncbi:restriction endonuclease subunit S [Sphaerotilus sp.]|uniref:restriction endonuclease subunit S n=1 Tax=Sphaerotilus sp. TaxID=2093942 RepID=UPI0025F594A6|nr:restriction endonuclease subunit S [Sphaerotilus sp.]